MRTTLCVFVAILIALVGAENAFAEAEAGQGYLTGMASYIDDDKRRGVEDGINGFQMGLGYAMNDRWNIEAIISAAIPDGSSESGTLGQEHRGYGLDLQRVFRRGERFSPYLLVGAGYFSVDPGGNVSEEEGGMYSFGAGFYLDVFDSSNVALRGEWRQRRDTATTSGSESDSRDDLISLGLQIPFGDSSPKWSDADGDGVADGMDRCPGTPAGTRVDAYGCELDSDGDGVKDSMDECPGTPRGVSVDAKGCPLDSDGDGVTDDKDKCPNTPAGAPVDKDGCALDSDNDGVPDYKDECPDTAAGVQVDIKGCEIKAEITLRGVNFETNSDRLLPGATRVLDDAAATLKKNPTIKVEVAGHTDSDGAAAYNEGLSSRRAQTVRDYLANSGVAADRMTVRGYGESQPIADNSTAAGKAENRRVVLRITAR